MQTTFIGHSRKQCCQQSYNNGATIGKRRRANQETTKRVTTQNLDKNHLMNLSSALYALSHIIFDIQAAAAHVRSSFIRIA